MTRINNPGVVLLDSDEAEDLADTLSFVDAWLRTASDETLEDLAEHIDSQTLPSAARAVTDGFIIEVGMHVVALRQRLKQANR